MWIKLNHPTQWITNIELIFGCVNTHRVWCSNHLLHSSQGTAGCACNVRQCRTQVLLPRQSMRLQGCGAVSKQDRTIALRHGFLNRSKNVAHHWDIFWLLFVWVTSDLKGAAVLSNNIKQIRKTLHKTKPFFYQCLLYIVLVTNGSINFKATFQR